MQSIGRNYLVNKKVSIEVCFDNVKLNHYHKLFKSKFGDDFRFFTNA